MRVGFIKMYTNVKKAYSILNALKNVSGVTQ
jgi:hypothetical protein